VSNAARDGVCLNVLWTIGLEFMIYGDVPRRPKARAGGSWDKSYMKDIPILVVVSYRFPENMRDELVLGSVWMAVENMLLAATNEGLGSCVYIFLDRREETN